MKFRLPDVHIFRIKAQNEEKTFYVPNSDCLLLLVNKQEVALPRTRSDSRPSCHVTQTRQVFTLQPM